MHATVAFWSGKLHLITEVENQLGIMREHEFFVDLAGIRVPKNKPAQEAARDYVANYWTGFRVEVKYTAPDGPCIVTDYKGRNLGVELLRYAIKTDDQLD